MEAKYSGYRFIGDIPSEWSVERLSNVAMLFGRIGWQGLRSDEFLDEGPFLVTGTDFSDGHVDWNSCVHISEERWGEASQIQLHNNDLLITKDGTVGKLAIVTELDDKASLNSGVMRIVPRMPDSYSVRFLYYVLASSAFTDWYEDITSGQSTIKHLFQHDFNHFVFACPPLDEQLAIADKLDRVIGGIDSALSIAKKQISTLERCRFSLIYEAVTKGLDRDVPTRPSSVEWIGDIPSDWKIVRQSLIATKIGSGKTPLGGNDSYAEDGIPLIRSQNVYGGKLHLEDVVYIDEATDAEMAGTRVVPGDVLLNITGASIGRSCVAPAELERANVNQHVCIIRPDKLYSDSRYLQYCWSTIGQSWISSYQVGATREAMNFSQIGKSRFPLPPLALQQQIADYLDDRCSRIDRILDLKRRQVDVLKRRRQSLIYEYVTGKRRVDQEA